jgi:hypothetical protein
MRDKSLCVVVLFQRRMTCFFPKNCTWVRGYSFFLFLYVIEDFCCCEVRETKVCVDIYVYIYTHTHVCMFLSMVLTYSAEGVPVAKL